LDYFLPVDSTKLNDDRLGRTLDQLEPHLVDIQEAVVLKLATKHHIDPAAIHYDITSIYFEGAYDEVDWIRLGYSRDKKPKKVQLNLGLNTTDKENFPVLWTDLPGNTQDTETVIENMNKLKDRFPRTQLIHIGDRAMFSQEIYQQAQEMGIDVIAALKTCKASQDLLESVKADDLPIIRYGGKTQEIRYRLGEYELVLDEETPLPPIRAIVIWSKRQADRAQRHREKKIAQRRQALADLQAKLNRPYYRTYKRISPKLCRIMGQDPVNEGFNVVLKGEDQALTLEVHEDPQVWDAQKAQDGLYVLVTTLDRTAMTTTEVFDFYKRQGSVEWAFRTVKNPLKVRPLFVQLPQRVRALLFIVMLALLIYSLIELLLRRHGSTLTPVQLFQQLSPLVLVQVCLPDNSLHFMLSPPTREEQPLLEALAWQSVRDWLQTQLSQRVSGLGPPEVRNGS
jgi:transposase